MVKQRILALLAQARAQVSQPVKLSGIVLGRQDPIGHWLEMVDHTGEAYGCMLPADQFEAPRSLTSVVHTRLPLAPQRHDNKIGYEWKCSESIQ